MANMLDPLHTQLLIRDLVCMLWVAVIFSRDLGHYVDQLALVALCFAGAAAACHDSATDGPAGITNGVLEAHHGCFVLASWEAFRDRSRAADFS